MARSLIRLALVCLCLVLSACGSGSTKEASSTTTAAPDVPASKWDSSLMPDPCRLATTTDVEKAIGRTTAAPSTQSSWPPGCDFPLDPTNVERVMVTENITDTAKTEYDQLASQAESQRIEDLGVPAFWEPSFKSLHAFANNAHYAVVLGEAHPDVQSLDKARLIMTKVVAVASKEPPR